MKSKKHLCQQHAENFFGFEQHDLWCNHCKRKKACARFIKPSVPFTKQFSCNICSEYFSDANAVINHIKKGHQPEESIKDSNKNQPAVEKIETEIEKCRKFYGLVQRDLWCNQCKWKKACARFTKSSSVVNTDKETINYKKENDDLCTSSLNTEKESKDIDNDEIKIEKDIIDNDSNEVPKELAVNYKKPKDDPEILDFINEVEMKMKEKFKKEHR